MSKFFDFLEIFGDINKNFVKKCRDITLSPQLVMVLVNKKAL